MSIIKKFIQNVELPIIVKAASGGGGKGMRVVTNEKEIDNAINSAKTEAKKSFNDDKVYLEKFLTTPKHIEIQILADSHGNVVTLGKEIVLYKESIKNLLKKAQVIF